MYAAAATALKLVDSALQVGGPASAQPSWVGLLMDYCKNTSVPLDFVSTHAYPAETSSLESQMAQLRVVQRLANTGEGKPLLITEWSSGGTDRSHSSFTMRPSFPSSPLVLASSARPPPCWAT